MLVFSVMVGNCLHPLHQWHPYSVYKSLIGLFVITPMTMMMTTIITIIIIIPTLMDGNNSLFPNQWLDETAAATAFRVAPRVVPLPRRTICLAARAWSHLLG